MEKGVQILLSMIFHELQSFFSISVELNGRNLKATFMFSIFKYFSNTLFNNENLIKKVLKLNQI